MSNNQEYNKKYREENRESINKQRREYYAKRKEDLLQRKKELYDPVAARNRRLLKAYGITAEQYDIMYAEQKGCCYICGKHETETQLANQFKGQRLNVDHCHTTGTVRKLLCSPCNTALGLLEEDRERVKKLYDYILQSGSVQSRI